MLDCTDCELWAPKQSRREEERAIGRKEGREGGCVVYCTVPWQPWPNDDWKYGRSVSWALRLRGVKFFPATFRLCFCFHEFPPSVRLPVSFTHLGSLIFSHTHTHSYHHRLLIWWSCVIPSQPCYWLPGIMIRRCKWRCHPHWLPVTGKKHGIIPIDRQWQCVKNGVIYID